MDPSERPPDVDEHPISRPLTNCPGCGSAKLDPVVEKERQTVHMLCRDCSRCWHAELGFVRRIAPYACLGCPERERCEAAFAADQAKSS
jgi:hypothetical protein